MALCRLCASLQNAEHLIRIKDQSNEIGQKLQKCFRINIEISDSMPKTVCQTCLDQLNGSYNFYSKVQEAQKKLKALFSSKKAEKRSYNVVFANDDTPPKDSTAHTIQQFKSIENTATSFQKQELEIKTEKQNDETRVTFKPLFLVRQVDQHNENKAGSRHDTAINDNGNAITSNQTRRAVKEEITDPVKRQKISICKINIEESDVDNLKQEAATDRDATFTTGNAVSITEEATSGDTDGYHPEAYSISVISHDDDQGPTSEENESMDFCVTTIIKEEEVIQEEPNIELLKTQFSYEELDEDSQNTSELSSAKMSKQPQQQPQQSKAKLKYYPSTANHKCHSCEDLSKQFAAYKDSSTKQYNTLLEILAEHKVLLDRIISQNAVATNIMSIFPIQNVEKLKELDALLVTQSDTYIRQIKSLLGGNAERNLHQIFGQEIIMTFNVDGSFGKNRLRDYSSVFAAMIDAISSFTESSDKTLRAAFQRQKKKFFKQTTRNKIKNNNDDENVRDSSDREN